LKPTYLSVIALFNPKGFIAQQERDLVITAVLLMLIVVVPVLTMIFFVAWKYRASNKSAKYTPNWDRSRAIAALRFGLPATIIISLAFITWHTSHKLDPRKPIQSASNSMTIQVVALQWKWLFIYPQQNIATLNYVQFPEKTSVHFDLTADGLMNSFWIPQLGGQMYAMAGMSTELNLMANDVGEYSGSAAEINGKGFAGMRFVAESSSKSDFDA
jgi:cytochrome o ubiquinol oxidase subunit 2